MEFNVYDVVAAVSADRPEREAVVFGGTRVTAGSFLGRANQFAHALLAAGLTIRTERAELARHESGQPHVAIYLRNCPEYLESTLGCFAARAVPLNVNFRYVANEVAYLLRDATANAVVFASEFATVVSEAIAQLSSRPTLLLQVADASDNALLPDARWCHDVIGSLPTTAPNTSRSPDDLYAIYTGGTTGRPKAVLWRQADAFCPLFGGRRADGTEWVSLDEIVAASRAGGSIQLAAAPFMHAAGMWPAIRSFVAGNLLVIPPVSARFDPAAFLDVLETEGVQYTNLAGDAFLLPIVEELRARPRSLPALRRISTGGTAASPRIRAALVEQLPHVEVYETVGASETGAQLAHVTTADGPFVSGAFSLLPRACVLAEDCARVLTPDVGGASSAGWIASSVRVPLGYLGDPAKTPVTFPTIEGVRFSVSGDRVVLRADGLVDLLGRDSGVINTGGEKVFAEEVERALMTHPAVLDAVVCGRPNERWGAEVVAIVQVAGEPTAAELQDAVRARLAAYKVPRSVIRVDAVRRGPAGKLDLVWARGIATGSLDADPDG